MWEDIRDGRLLVELASAAWDEGPWMEQVDRAAREQSEEISPRSLSSISYWQRSVTGEMWLTQSLLQYRNVSMELTDK